MEFPPGIDDGGNVFQSSDGSQTATATANRLFSVAITVLLAFAGLILVGTGFSRVLAMEANRVRRF
jgi:hypothetical protein